MGTVNSCYYVTIRKQTHTYIHKHIHTYTKFFLNTIYNSIYDLPIDFDYLFEIARVATE